MAHAKKLSRKELKRPDEFVQTGTAVVDYLQKHGTLVLSSLGGIVVVGVLLSLGSWYFEQSAVRAGAALGDALEMAERPVLEDGGAAATSDDPFFTSEEEKKEKVNAALEAVRIDHSGTAAAAVATLELADRAYRAGEYDSALADYERFLKESSRDDRMRFSALEGLGYTLEAKDDLEGALKAFERLGKEGGDFYKPYALVHEARVLVALKRPDDARRRAQQVVDEFSESAVRAEADTLLGQLPPAPAAADAEGSAEAAGE
ncbi:MAG: tetratricopeptide repeat protein [Deltaproteobacteria bacterium]|nr:tetratricopeptide repeat protein [Deltaproteobacteria bacterium]